MRVTVTAKGEVVVDADGPAQAAAFVRELYGKKGAGKKPKQLELESVEQPLTQELADTWNWLVENDSPQGASAAEVSEGLSVEVGAAGYRLRTLLEKGLAHQPSRGRFRRGDS